MIGARHLAVAIAAAMFAFATPAIVHASPGTFANIDLGNAMCTN